MSRKIIKNIEQLKDAFSIIKKTVEKEPVILECSKLADKRTNKQLRTYWLLINTITVFFNDYGNNYTAEEVSAMIKIKAGLFKEIDTVKVPLSISDRAKRTKEEMAKLINTIIEIGVEYNIENCYIEDKEFQDFLNYYE